MYTVTDKHPDILFLEKRMEYILFHEEYEKAVIIKRWLEELKIYHESKKNNKERVTERTTSNL